MNKKVAVIMGSDSDLPVMQEAVDKLKLFGIPYEVRVISAHRTPAAAEQFCPAGRETLRRTDAPLQLPPDSELSVFYPMLLGLSRERKAKKVFCTLVQWEMKKREGNWFNRPSRDRWRHSRPLLSKIRSASWARPLQAASAP